MWIYSYYDVYSLNVSLVFQIKKREKEKINLINIINRNTKAESIIKRNWYSYWRYKPKVKTIIINFTLRILNINVKLLTTSCLSILSIKLIIWIKL